MTEQECLEKMVPPGQRRAGKWRSGVIQILVTHSCDKACVNCTQGSQLAAPKWMMTPDQFDLACQSLKGYFGVVGMFGGNPALHPQFSELCEIMRRYFPKEQRGIWCNNPITVEKAEVMRQTFNPGHSNLNCHLDEKAYDIFKAGWPESMPFGQSKDSRHSPPWTAMKDIDVLPVFDKHHHLIAEMENTEDNRHTLIADCDINQHWSAGIGVFRGELRAWFCEIAMAQSIHHQHETKHDENNENCPINDPETYVNPAIKGLNCTCYSYPDTGLDPTWHYEHETHPGEKLGRTVSQWWQLGMPSFVSQVRKHCHDCGVPMRGYGELAMDKDAEEQVSQTHSNIYKPKRVGRAVELVMTLSEINPGRIDKTTHYVQNAAR